jgi:hypothetical protein
MEVRFSLSSSPVFSRTDTATDSERFYNSVLNLLEDVDEQEEVNDLISWWNRYIAFAFICLKTSNCILTAKFFPLKHPTYVQFPKTVLWGG